MAKGLDAPSGPGWWWILYCGAPAVVLVDKDGLVQVVGVAHRYDLRDLAGALWWPCQIPQDAA